ncbi:hypothetical protein POVWA2_024560 [Plasmodium ovale wallikeri]|uniref:Uncharacterized protein n=1 Tax=Plasmodium ovale wallikeri TaxID=864142 RepID=A0A1A8YTE9_PLAOA|nr:hypothetical protein POVWA1_024700 [Plasmodium ovale wallikeri]SBT35340.1 hypothetical protein POVWA2_024560 [Plasmodium ovale wallikeri]
MVFSLPPPLRLPTCFFPLWRNELPTCNFKWCLTPVYRMTDKKTNLRIVSHVRRLTQAHRFTYARSKCEGFYMPRLKKEPPQRAPWAKAEIMKSKK